MPTKIPKGFEQYINPLELKPIPIKTEKAEARKRLMSGALDAVWGVRTQSVGSGKTNKRRPAK